MSDITDHDAYFEVTPRGLRRFGKTSKQPLQVIVNSIQQAGYLAWWTLTERTFGRVLGTAWLVLEPIFQAAVLFFILSHVFGLRGSDVSFLSIFASITLWRLTLNLISVAPTLLVSRASILQQTNFPIILIVLEMVGIELVLTALNMLVVFVIMLYGGVTPTAMWLLFPVILLIQIIFTLPVMIALMGIGTFVRDTPSIVNVVMQLVFYASPIVYSMERIGEPYRTVLYWINPLTHIIPAYRDVLFDNKLPPLMPLCVIAVVSIIVLALELRVFQTLRHRFYQFL